MSQVESCDLEMIRSGFSPGDHQDNCMRLCMAKNSRVRSTTTTHLYICALLALGCVAYGADILMSPSSSSASTCKMCGQEPVLTVASSTTAMIQDAARHVVPTEVMWRTASGDLDSWDDLVGHPTVLAFVYTRCTNPLRCAAVTKSLGRLQASLAEAHLADQVQIRLATLDAEYDTPERLTAFAAAHGLSTGATAAQVMAVDQLSLDVLPQAIGLQAQWRDGEITGHASQVFLLDRTGRVAVVHPLAQPDLEVVMTQVQALLAEAGP